MQVSTKMNLIQLHLLQFFTQREVSNQEVEDIQRLIAQYYLNKAEIELEAVMQEKNIQEIDIEALAHQHLRTPYHKQ